MAEKFVVYSKRSGEPRVPLTIRIEWLPDGTIAPLMYWTPDGACFKVISCSVGVPIAFLKDHGEGLRFKARSEIIETPEPFSELLHTQYDLYLYLADKRFCEKNIVDDRYAHPEKEFISVTLDVFSDGDYELVYFAVREERYMVEKTITIEPRGSFKAGGIGICHRVEGRLVNANNDYDTDPQYSYCRPGALYWELNKWFVLVSSTTAKE